MKIKGELALSLRAQRFLDLYEEIDDASAWCHCLRVVSVGLSPIEIDSLKKELDLMF